MCQKRYRPRYRVGEVNRGDGVILRYLKNDSNPKNTQSARADKRHNHRHNRVTDTSHHTNHNVHTAAKRVCGGDYSKTDNARRNNIVTV